MGPSLDAVRDSGPSHGTDELVGSDSRHALQTSLTNAEVRAVVKAIRHDRLKGKLSGVHSADALRQSAEGMAISQGGVSSVGSPMASPESPSSLHGHSAAIPGAPASHASSVLGKAEPLVRPLVPDAVRSSPPLPDQCQLGAAAGLGSVLAEVGPAPSRRSHAQSVPCPAGPGTLLGLSVPALMPKVSPRGEIPWTQSQKLDPKGLGQRAKRLPLPSAQQLMNPVEESIYDSPDLKRVSTYVET